MKKQAKPKIKAPGSLKSIGGKATDLKNDKFPIVGIGTSAGGLEAMEQFFSNMPLNSGMAFVVIQHLDPTHKGLLRELIQRITDMQVITVTDRLKVKPNCVYIIPPNSSMSILNGVLHLFEPVEVRGLRLPVDLFFRSLADDQQEKSIGIILSGMGSDGSAGLKAIKEKSGLVLVQDPASAKFDGMPRSAIESVLVDIVAPANELPEKLMAITRQFVNIRISQEVIRDSSSLEKIILILRTQTGHDFSLYKKTTLYRRIERRMNVHSIEKIASYVRYLQENLSESEILFKELLIGVTSFFRDPDVWNKLIENTLPALFDRLPYGHILRAWIPGCSTGEEAYSLAIAFKETMEKTNTKNFSLQIFATDIDSTAIEKARKGTYPQNISTDVSQNRLNRFFSKSDDQFRINNEIREMVVFAPQNVIKDPPFTKLDVLVCRNLLIYMESALQKKLISLFHNSLNRNGLLILGSAENNDGNNESFSTIDSKLRIYQRSDSSISDELVDFPSSFSRNAPPLIGAQTTSKEPDNLQNLTDQLLLQQFSPASVLVTNNGDILYITGSTGKYLSPAAGKANMNIFVMACEGLRHELPIAFRKATQNYNKVILRNIKVGSNGGNKFADITIQQIQKPLALKGRLLVIFTDVPVPDVKPGNQTKQIKAKASDSSLQAEYEIEMVRIKEELQSTREEMQTTQEEQKSTNEELQSANEELQSTNEELTTSKEEMQSLNEELHTLNGELQSKIEYSLRLNNDMNNLLNSIEIATLFLDRELNIRQYTDPVTKIFKFIKTDVGRLFTDQVTDLEYPGLYDDTVEVLRTLAFIVKEVPTNDGRWFKIRIMPYRTADDKIDGLVITFIDITNLKKVEASLKDSQTMLRSLIQVVPGVILALSSDGMVMEFNPEAEKLFGRKHKDVIGKSYVDLFIPESSRKKVRLILKKLLAGNLPDRYVNLVNAVNGDELLIEWSAHKLLDEHGDLIGIINIGINITKP